jgi:hypothetical protein
MGDFENSIATGDQPPTLEQGQADRGKATAATQTCLVDSDEAPDRGSPSRPCHV